jgi:hypothetical protein
MKASELKPKNILYWGKEIITITGVEEQDIYSPALVTISKDFTNVNVSLDEVKPIPLNEEWLLKMGFEYIEVGEEVYEQKWLLNMREILWGPASEGNYYHSFLNGGEVKYLHQLQNLYFALTGEELTINENN